jgi:hypothetical protein
VSKVCNNGTRSPYWPEATSHNFFQKFHKTSKFSTTKIQNSKIKKKKKIQNFKTLKNIWKKIFQKYFEIIQFDLNTAICLEKILAILDNLGWYCGVTNVFIRQRQIQIAWKHEIIVNKIKETLNFVVKIKL